MGVGVAGVANYTNTSSGTASNVVAYGGIGGPYEYVSFFSVLNWFAKGEPGAWYDPSDFQPNWRRNLLTWSEDFRNAAWATAPTMVFSTNIIAPDGTNTANVINSAGTSVPNRLFFASGNYVFDITKQYSLTFYAKAISERYIQVYTNYGVESVTFDMQNGAVTQTTGIAGFSNGEGALDQNGFYRFSVLYAPRTTSIGIRYAFTDNNPTPGYSPNIATTGLTFSFWGAQLEQSSSASTYQKITDGIQDYYTVQPQPVLFQDSAGTIPVTAVEQPVGLMLDKSKGLALGAELVTNGDFSNGTTGWGLYLSTISNVNNTLRVTAIAANTTAYGTQALTGLVIGSWYALSITQIVGAGSSLIYNFVGPTAFSNTYRNSSDPSTKTTNSYFLATATTCYITVGTYGPATGNYADFDNISVKQIAGNHAFQATAANRPMLSARVNLLTKTEDFSDAVWTKTGILVPVLSTAVDGKATGWKITEDTSAGIHADANSITSSPPTTYVLSVYAKYNGRYLRLVGVLNGGSSVPVFNLQNGTVLSGSGTIVDAGNGWYKCSTQITSTLDSSGYSQYIGLAKTDGSFIYTGDGTSGIYVCYPDLRPTNSGALLPPYQRVNTASDYDTVGFPLYLKANGTSSAMSTNSIDFSSTDKMTVVTGVRKLSDGLMGVLETSANSGLNLQAFGIISKLSIDPTIYSVISGGSAIAAIVPSSAYSLVSPISNVLTLLSSISAPSLAVKYNGVVVGSNTTTQGAGNFGNYPLYLFARNQTSAFLNGQFYGAIIRGAQSDTASVTQTENYMATKTGITF